VAHIPLTKLWDIGGYGAMGLWGYGARGG